MKIEVIRDTLTDTSTIGSLFINGVWHCHSLEDMVRVGPKVFGKTAIPCGMFEVTIDTSPRFRKLMIHILSVPNFSGVRVHKGNKAEDTEGCLLVGSIRGYNWIGNCSGVYNSLFKKIYLALKTEKVYIEISIEEGAMDTRTHV
jgi:hypothetical protein